MSEGAHSASEAGALGSNVELFDRYATTVYRRCLQILGDDDQAQDAVQEVFLRVINRRGSFRAEASPVTWIYSIATTYCLQQLRNQRRRSEKLRQRGPAASLATSSTGVEERVALAEIIKVFDRKTREAAFYRHVDGMSVAEVAAITGVSRKTVSRRLARFRRRVRGQWLQPLEPEHPHGADDDR